MTAEVLPGWANRDPYKPFRLRLRNGGSYSVKQPSQLGGNERVPAWFGEAGCFVCDADSVLEIIYDH